MLGSSTLSGSCLNTRPCAVRQLCLLSVVLHTKRTSRRLLFRTMDCKGGKGGKAGKAAGVEMGQGGATHSPHVRDLAEAFCTMGCTETAPYNGLHRDNQRCRDGKRGGVAWWHKYR